MRPLRLLCDARRIFWQFDLLTSVSNSPHAFHLYPSCLAVCCLRFALLYTGVFWVWPQ
jgi:hypothetical protein